MRAGELGRYCTLHIVRRLPLLIVLLLTHPLLGAYASRNAFIPIAGRAVGGDGRRYETTVTITNPHDEPVEVRLSFLRSGTLNRSPRTTAIRFAPNETRRFDDATPPDAFGALHVEADRDVLAHARLYSVPPQQPSSNSVASSFNAIPAQFAVGTGDTAFLHGVQTSSDFRCKLYLVETIGQSLAFTLALVDGSGRTIATKHEYLGPGEHRGTDLHAEFPNAPSAALLRISGMSGNGRLIVAGVQIATGSQDGTAYEMSFATQPRWRIPPGEIAAYVTAAVAVSVAILLSRRRA
jgi:hypothetical protein